MENQLELLQKLISMLTRTFLIGTTGSRWIVLHITYRRGANKVRRERITINRTLKNQYAVSTNMVPTRIMRFYKKADRILKILLDFSGKSNLYFSYIVVIVGRYDEDLGRNIEIQLFSLSDFYATDLITLLGEKWQKYVTKAEIKRREDAEKKGTWSQLF